MSYTNTTPGNLQIPYVARGEDVSESSELRAARIIESQIIGLTRAFAPDDGYFILSEGVYTGNFVTGASTVSLAAFQAVVNSIYLSGAPTWTGLGNSLTHYLYVQLVESDIYGEDEVSSRKAAEFVALSNTSGVTPTNAMLLAKAVTTGSAITVTSGSDVADTSTFSGGKKYGRFLPMQNPFDPTSKWEWQTDGTLKLFINGVQSQHYV